MCFLKMLISPIKGHKLMTHESALACRHDFFGLLSVLKQCLNQLPTSGNQETPLNKKLQIFQLLLETWEMWLALQSCLVKAKAQQQGPHGRGVVVLCATIPDISHRVPLAGFIHQQQLLGLQDSCIHNSCLQFIVFPVPKE